MNDRQRARQRQDNINTVLAIIFLTAVFACYHVANQESAQQSADRQKHNAMLKFIQRTSDIQLAVARRIKCGN